MAISVLPILGRAAMFRLKLGFGSIPPTALDGPVPCHCAHPYEFEGTNHRKISGRAFQPKPITGRSEMPDGLLCRTPAQLAGSGTFLAIRARLSLRQASAALALDGDLVEAVVSRPAGLHGQSAHDLRSSSLGDFAGLCLREIRTRRSNRSITLRATVRRRTFKTPPIRIKSKTASVTRRTPFPFPDQEKILTNTL